MFGLCVLNKTVKAVFVAFAILFFSTSAFAQAQQATIANDAALVYRDADFDAPIVATLNAGAVFSISKGKKGPFHKIRLKPGTVGWIADSDVRLGVHKIQEIKESQPEQQPEEEKKPFFATRYRGPVFEMINFAEDTLGKERSQPLLFYGLKFAGFNTVISGDIYVESNILIHVGAPSYYKDYTQKEADGFIFISNLLLQTVIPSGKSMIYFYGFGPMFKYSRFNLELANGSNADSYTADDMTLGAVFNVGAGTRVGPTTVRADMKYYWEKAKYFGLGLNLGWEF